MVLPLLPLGALGLHGLYKTAQGLLNSNEAGNTNDTAESIVRSASRRMQDKRKATNTMLEDYGSRKLRAFNGVIEDFLTTFGQLKNVETLQAPVPENLELGEFSRDVLQGLRDDYQLLKDSGLGLGAGLTGGAAVAFGAYSGTMALATAGTGTAISALGGVAATNATLAWLGGGTIAAGGGGMAMGAVVLGGLVAAPALAILGYFVGSKGNEALANAQSNLEKARTFRAEMDKAIEQLSAMLEVTSLANRTLSKISALLRRATHEMRIVIKTHGEDYRAYDEANRNVVFRAVKFAQLVKAMVDTPIMDEQGNLVLATTKRVYDIAGLAEGQGAVQA